MGMIIYQISPSCQPSAVDLSYVSRKSKYYQPSAAEQPQLAYLQYFRGIP
jgi:hypothetical protein